MNWQSRISFDENVLQGKPVIRGTRIAVDHVLQLLAQGWSEAEILENCPGVTADDVVACLLFERCAAEQWDRQIEADIREGRLDAAGQRADDDFESGKCTPL